MINLIKDAAKVTILSAFVLFSAYVAVAAWSEPSTAPTGGNASAPLDVSATGQTKAGGLILNTGGATNGLIVSAGKVGIGTASPFDQLVVTGSIPAAATGTFTTGAGPQSVYVQGRYAYVVNNTANTLQVVDVTNPASPAAVGSVAITSPYSVYVLDRYAYVGTSAKVINVIDISNPASPTSVGTVTLANVPYSIYVRGNYLYATNYGSAQFQVVDVGNPAAPYIAATVSTNSIYPRYIAGQGRYLYVGNYYSTNTLQIYDISNPLAPTNVGNIATSGYLFAAQVVGRYAYVTNVTNVNTLQIIDISNPATPASVGSINVGAYPATVAVNGRYAYVGNLSGNSISVIDISNPASPAAVGTITTGTSPSFFQINGRYLYVVNSGSNSLQIFDIGGAYVQQLESGSLETGTIQAEGNGVFNGDLDVRGNLTVGGSTNFTGSGMAQSAPWFASPTGTRAAGTVYTNNTSKPIFVALATTAQSNGNVADGFYVYLGTPSAPTNPTFLVQAAVGVSNGGPAPYLSAFFIVPPGYAYKATAASGYTSGPSYWTEYQ